jgi:exopolysaccharide biosynthesis protein
MMIGFRVLLSWILFLSILSPMATWASSKPTVTFQKTFGTHPSLLRYYEYEYNGKIVSVIVCDPQFFNFAVTFANPPKSVSQFHNDDGAALFTVNGGYWDYDYRPTDLCIVKGRIIKAENSINSHFGLFAVRRNGELIIHDLKEKPLKKVDINDFLYALKSGPHLLRKGVPVIFKSNSSHTRTIVAKNIQNNVLFVITKFGSMTYSEMINFLIDYGFSITDAFNLDGGSSTGFVIGRGNDSIFGDSSIVANVVQVRMKAPNEH